MVVSGNKRVPAPPASRIAFFVTAQFLTEFSAWSNRRGSVIQIVGQALGLPAETTASDALALQ
jgi:hypothetical protein